MDWFDLFSDYACKSSCEKLNKKSEHQLSKVLTYSLPGRHFMLELIIEVNSNDSYPLQLSLLFQP